MGEHVDLYFWSIARGHWTAPRDALLYTCIMVEHGLTDLRATCIVLRQYTSDEVTRWHIYPYLIATGGVVVQTFLSVEWSSLLVMCPQGCILTVY